MATPRLGSPLEVTNRTLRAADARLAELERKLAAIVQPILEQQAYRAAARFRKTATDHLTAGALTAAADAVAPTSTMVALKPRPDEAERIALAGGTEPGRLHVTLCYLGDVEGDLSPVVEALRPVAALMAPLAGVVGGAGFFAPNDEGVGPAILLPDVPGLVELRVATAEALADAGIGYGRDHGFQAHVTVAYYDQDGNVAGATDGGGGVPIDDPRPAFLEPLHFDAILVVRGDVVEAEIPLVGVPPLTAAAGTPEEVAAARAELDARQDELLAALRKEDPAGVAAAKQAANSAKAKLRRLVAQSPLWTSAAGDEIIDVGNLTATLRGKTDPVRRRFLETAMLPTLDAAGIKFDLTNPFAGKVLAQAGSQVTKIAESTRLNVMRIIGQSYQQGLSIPETAKAIQVGMLSAAPWRATMIARTELAGAQNGGSLAATQIVASATGTAYYKEWHTAPGAPHPRHELYEGLDGQTVPLDEPFDVGGSSCMYPGDPDGAEEETINCRCALAYTETPAEGPAPEETGATGQSDLATATSTEQQAVDTVSVGAGPPVPPEFVAKIHELGLNKSYDELAPMTEAGRETFAAGNSTEALYSRDGVWDAQRAAEIHTPIISRFFEGKVPPAAEAKKTYYFTAGGGASGKSAAEFLADGKLTSLKELEARQDTIAVDPDRIKKMLPEFQELERAGDSYAASGVHEESSYLAKVIAKAAEQRGYNVVLDTTGSTEKFIGKIEAAKKAGYETQVTMFSIPTNDAIVRSLARGLGDGPSAGRFVMVPALKDAHAGASSAFAVWKDSKAVDAWRLYDNTGKAPQLVAEFKDGQLAVHDEGKLAEILAKRYEKPGVEPPPPPPPKPAELSGLMPGPSQAAVDRLSYNRFDRFSHFAERRQMTLDEYHAALDQAIADAVSGSDVKVRVPSDVLPSILTEGRWKSQFEAGGSRGMFDPVFRGQTEATMFGYPTNLDPAKRPIYGYLSGSKEPGAVRMYGDVAVTLKAGVRDRSTFVLGDSLGPASRGEVLPAPLTEPTARALPFDPRADGDPLAGGIDLSQLLYGEAEIHGGLTVADIASVDLSHASFATVEQQAYDRLRVLRESRAKAEAMIESGVKPGNILEEADKAIAETEQRLELVKNNGAGLRRLLEEHGIQVAG